MGLTAALVSVYGGRVLSLGLSSVQESISFYGFLATGLVYGVAESLSRWRKWRELSSATVNGGE